jgi:hypothetical protein
MNFLSDLIPAKWRKVVYGTVGLLSLLAAIPGLLPEAWQAQAVAVLAVLSSALAVGNVAPKDQPGGDPPKDAGLAFLEVVIIIIALAVVVIAIKVF